MSVQLFPRKVTLFGHRLGKFLSVACHASAIGLAALRLATLLLVRAPQEKQPPGHPTFVAFAVFAKH